MRDLHNNIGVDTAIAPAVYDADVASAAIDLLGFGAADIAWHVGVGGITFNGTNKIELALQHSDDGVAWSDVALADLNGAAIVPASGVVWTIAAEHAAADVIRVGYCGGKRYLRAKANFAGTHSAGTPLSAAVIKGRAANKPVDA